MIIKTVVHFGQDAPLKYTKNHELLFE